MKEKEFKLKWPVGCHSPNSCQRHGQCMYVQCRHQGKDVKAAIDEMLMLMKDGMSS